MERRTLLKSLAGIPVAKMLLDHEDKKVEVNAVKLEPGTYLFLFNRDLVNRQTMISLSHELGRQGICGYCVSTMDPEEAMKIYKMEKP